MIELQHARPPDILSGPPPHQTATSVVELLRRAERSRAPWLHFHRGARVEVLSGRDVWLLARGWAAALQGAGVARGDRVVVLQPNSAHFVGAFFGAQLLGAIPAPVAWPFFAADAARRAASLAPLLSVAAPSAIATTEQMAEQIVGTIRAVSTPASTGPRSVAEPAPEAPAFIQFTSGTTAHPRGAVISHGAACHNATAIGEALGISEADVGVSWLPLFHDMGLVGALLSSLLLRYPLHVMTPAEFLLHPSQWLARLADTRATLTAAPNFAYDLAAKRGQVDDAADLSALRAALNGSEPVHPGTLRSFHARFASSGLRADVVTPVYGLAENTLAVAFSTPGCPRPELEMSGRHIPSVGRPVPGVSVAVMGPGGRLLPVGTEGEIVVRGPSLMSGYFGDDAATCAALRDGWLHTGDLGVIASGELYVTGREKDLVIKNGKNFQPYDIERIAIEAAAAPPNGAAAFSVPNPARGTEDLVLVVEVRSEPRAELLQRIGAELWSELSVRADAIHLVEVGSLPRTTSGKVQRRACAARFGGLA